MSNRKLVKLTDKEHVQFNKKMLEEKDVWMRKVFREEGCLI